MFKFIALLSALVALPAVASAETGKAPKPTACQQFQRFAGPGGAEIGVCLPTRAGGKPTVLRSFQVVSLKDASGQAVQVMVGYR